MFRSLAISFLPALVVAAGFTFCFAPKASGQETIIPDAHTIPPFVTGYDEETDSFQYQRGALTYFRPMIGGPEGYTGNRLTQFRYMGPRKTAGLYRILDDYNEAKKLDPAKYKYRLRW